MMRKFAVVLAFIAISCLPEVKTELEPDYVVFKTDYNFDNGVNNVIDRSEPWIIKQRNLVIIRVDSTGSTSIEDEFVSDDMITSELKKYIKPSPDVTGMPETVEEAYQYAGTVMKNKSLIVMGIFDPSLDYNTYNSIRNKIFSAYNQVRDDYGRNLFGKTAQEMLSSDREESDDYKWEELKQIIPIRYQEVVEKN